jgi:RNA polymerase sigma-70 factor (ECF subfamily)
MIEDWYRRYGESVHRRCRRFLRDEARASDATQDVFVIAFDKLSTFRGEGSPRSWLLTIADRRCLSELRKRTELLIADEPPRQSLPEPTCEDSDLERMLLRDEVLVRLLVDSPDDIRQIVVMRFVDEYSMEEISARLGIPRRTAQRKLERFYVRVRKYLKRLGRERA